VVLLLKHKTVEAGEDKEVVVVVLISEVYVNIAKAESEK
jgi:hypothetical protein